ncbi:HECT-domain-containing protein [Seiridium cupressi]
MAFGSRRHHPLQDRNGLNPTAPAPPRRPAPNPPLGDLDVFAASRSQQVQPESSSDDDVEVPETMSSQGRLAHSRSMSHPFPSLFASKKPRKQPSRDETIHDNFSRAGQSTSRPTMTPTKPHRGPTDFANGNCMTCGGKVRWPKELSIFRCTICATINDLKPYTPKSEEGRPLDTSRPLSLDHTRRLVRHCLQQALNSFAGLDGQKLSPGARPGKPLPKGSGDYFSKLNPSSQHGRSPSHGATPPVSGYSPVFDDHGDGHLEPNPSHRISPATRSHSTSYPDPRSLNFPLDGRPTGGESLDPKRVFKPVEDYLISSFGSHTNINTSFIPRRPSFNIKPQPQMRIKRKPVPQRQEPIPNQDDALVTELDAKMLLVGDLAENAQWWTGGQQEMPRSRSQRKEDSHTFVSSRSPRVDWGEVLEWYTNIIDAARPWTGLYKESRDTNQIKELSGQERQQFEAIVLEAQGHLQRVLLKCNEMLLKRPGRLLVEPQDVRFLLLIIVNPLLVSDHRSYGGEYQHLGKGKHQVPDVQAVNEERSAIGRHSGLIKRILGLISNSSDQCHHQLVAWFSKLPEHLFLQIKDLIGSFVNYRLRRQSEKRVEVKVDLTAGLIPEMPNSRTGATAASLHAALTPRTNSQKQKQSAEPPRLTYCDDWQLKAGAKVMALVFAANNLTHVKRNAVSVKHAHGHLLATSDFYNTLLDCLDFKTDFEMWESRKGKFAFCQYPFFLSIAAKIEILEFDAKRQMHGKARDAFFDSLLTHKSNTQYLFLSVRRECLVEDSLAKVSEVVGSGSEDIKKGLRIEFQGEEGVDAGGLRKEWFQLLVRDVFNPDHGLFVFDEDSQYCYFNPHTFETTDQYFLVGVVLGLAIYNSVILDVAFPPFAFRKLLAAAPASVTSNSILQRPTMAYTLDDLAEYRPRLANGLRQLLEFEGDVESTFCLDFAVEVERYGTRSRVPLCWGGDTKPVTNANRREYVDLYVRYLLDESVKRQFEPFKRGFFTVCAGNALSLFRPEEIELLVRGSDEPLDITSLRAVAKYTNWDGSKNENEPRNEPTIDWFWDSFAAATVGDQRRLLSFITGSDRIPAMGATSLIIKISCLGDDTGRYPTARTCFNVLNLFRYARRERLETSLWQAVNESEGFGLR